MVGMSNDQHFEHTPDLSEIRLHWGLAVDVHRRAERLAQFDRAIAQAIRPPLLDREGLAAASDAAEAERTGEGYANADTIAHEAVDAYLVVAARKAANPDA